MQTFHHSRARILFEVACAFGISASCVGAWMQTYATAMLPAAAIAALYGLVRASDMLRRGPEAVESVKAVEAPVVVASPAPEFADSVVAEVAAPSAKRPRKASKPKVGRGKPEAEPEPVQFVAEPQPEIVAAFDEPEPEVAALADEPEIVELPPELRVVESASDEAHYVPATPLFEAEPFVRQQRAAFGRKAR